MSEEEKRPSAVEIFRKGLDELWIFDPSRPNGFEVPGQGFYGGMPDDLAAKIVYEHNKLLKAKWTPQ